MESDMLKSAKEILSIPEVQMKLHILTQTNGAVTQTNHQSQAIKCTE